jgi:hypothetical protein
MPSMPEPAAQARRGTWSAPMRASSVAASTSAPVAAIVPVRAATAAPEAMKTPVAATLRGANRDSPQMP